MKQSASLRKKIILAVIAMSLVLTSCGKVGPRIENVIGTVCSVNAYEDGTKKLYDSLFDCLRNVDQQFSTTIESSDVCRVNELAGKDFATVSKDVFYVVEKSLYFAELSEGAFDPTVGPLVNLWNINSENPYVPDQHEIEGALSLVDFRQVILRVLDEKGEIVFTKKIVHLGDDTEPYSQNSFFVGQENKDYTYQIMLLEKNMKLELGGIAKGFAADKLCQILSGEKVKRAVIDLGGNVYVFGEKPEGNWSIGVKNPLDGKSVVAAVQVAPNRSVVTSGVYERYFEEEGIRYHHILDVATGKPSWGGETEISREPLCGTTIICSRSIDADALSTIAFLLGPEKFMERIESQKSVLGEVQFLYIYQDKKIALSQNLAESLNLLDEDFYLESLN